MKITTHHLDSLQCPCHSAMQPTTSTNRHRLNSLSFGGSLLWNALNDEIETGS